MIENPRVLAVSRPPPAELRLLTYLAPGLPMELFEGVTLYLGETLGIETRMSSETSVSAPLPGEIDPFTTGEADVGFLCSPGYFQLSDRRPPPIELVPAAFQFDDPRTEGKPVYFAELAVAISSPVRSLLDLRGSRWAYNDPSSLSGYFSMLEALTRISTDVSFFQRAIHAGSHHEALCAILEGRADCAALDSNFIAMECARDPAFAQRIRIVETWGPYPVQPIVVRSALPRSIKDALAASLLRMHEQAGWMRLLAKNRVRRLVPISEANFAAERAVFEACIRKRAI